MKDAQLPKTIVIIGGYRLLGQYLIQSVQESYGVAHIFIIEHCSLEKYIKDDCEKLKNTNIHLDYNFFDFSELQVDAIFKFIPKHATIIYLLDRQHYFFNNCEKYLDNFFLYFASMLVKNIADKEIAKTIYLTDLLPQVTKMQLPEHLKISWEIEHVLRQLKNSLYIVRCNLILAPESFSLLVVQKLLQHFFIIPHLYFFKRQLRPVYYLDVVEVMVQILQEKASSESSRVVVLQGPVFISYLNLILMQAKLQQKTLWIIPTFGIERFILKYLISFGTGFSSCSITYLLAGLRFDRLQVGEWKFKKNWVEPKEGLKEILGHPQFCKQSKKLIFIKKTHSDKNNIVLRIDRPAMLNTEQLLIEYCHWLPSLFFYIVRAEMLGNHLKVYIHHRSNVLFDWKFNAAPLVNFEHLQFTLHGGFFRKIFSAEINIREVQVKNKFINFILIKKVGLTKLVSKAAFKLFFMLFFWTIKKFHQHLES